MKIDIISHCLFFLNTFFFKSFITRNWAILKQHVVYDSLWERDIFEGKPPKNLDFTFEKQKWKVYY